jgi:hypothetical protein
MSSKPTRFPVWVPLLLGVLCIGLGAGLIYRHQTAKAEKVCNVGTIDSLSNSCERATLKLREQVLVNQTLEKDLATQATELEALSNNLAAVSAQFTETQTQAKSVTEKAQDQEHRQDVRIANLEVQRTDLTSKITELNGSISNLVAAIAVTQSKLDSSEADREVLTQELKKLQAQKSDLERKLYDLAQLREQVHKLKAELAVNRRLDWIRRGLLGNLKGAELLQKGFAKTTPAQRDFNLDVEVSRDQGAKVLAPLR